MPFIHLGSPTLNNSKKPLYGISLRPNYLPAIIDIIKFYNWKDIIYLYLNDDGKLSCHKHFKSFTIHGDFDCLLNSINN